MDTGLEFKYKDGTNEYYDPVTDFEENQKEYCFYVGGTQYVIDKEEVESIREYPLCEVCGYELSDHGCNRCILEEELKQIKNEQQNIHK